jgi:hypothetical protein
MTAAKQRENIRIPDTCGNNNADRTPWESGSAAEITDRIDEPGNNKISWSYLEE